MELYFVKKLHLVQNIEHMIVQIVKVTMICVTQLLLHSVRLESPGRSSFRTSALQSCYKCSQHRECICKKLLGLVLRKYMTWKNYAKKSTHTNKLFFALSPRTQHPKRCSLELRPPLTGVRITVQSGCVHCLEQGRKKTFWTGDLTVTKLTSRAHCHYAKRTNKNQ